MSPVSVDRGSLNELLAYQLWERRGQPVGSPLEDWLKGEQLLEIALHVSGGIAPSLPVAPTKGSSIVFDTNAYRNLSLAVSAGVWSIAELRREEQQRTVNAYASPTVIMELASHLWDTNDPHYQQCRMAMELLYEHCRTDSGQIRCLADAESLVAHMLYQRFPSEHSVTLEKLARLTAAIFEAHGQPLQAHLTGMCKALADHVNVAENAFAGDIHAIVQWLKPGFTGWDPFSSDKTKRRAALNIVRDAQMPRYLAAALVVKARLSLDLPIDGPDLEGMADAVLDHCSASIAIYRSILEQLVSSGWNPTTKKRTNSLWDMQVVLGIGEELSGGLPRIVLVTADRGIVTAAGDALRSSSVRSLSSYIIGLHV